MPRPLEVPVLIVGGGSVGLLVAVGLRLFGVDCMVVEKHASTLDFPKGRRVTTRTVEIFRQWGLEAAVSEVSLAQADSLFVFEGETLLGADFQRRALPFDEVTRSSPTRELICSQERLEPVLRNRAQHSGADVRFLTEVVGFIQDDEGVTAETVVHGKPVSVRASYLVAADGVRGRTRDALGRRSVRSGHVRSPRQRPGRGRHRNQNDGTPERRVLATATAAGITVRRGRQQEPLAVVGRVRRAHRTQRVVDRAPLPRARPQWPR